MSEGSDPVRFDPPGDSLGRGAVCRYRATIPILGIPVAFETNSPNVLEVWETAFGRWRALEGEVAAVEEGPVSVRVVVQPGDEGEADHAPIVWRILPDGRQLLGTPGSVGVTDAARREAVAFVTPALAADREHFRQGALQGLALGVLSHLDRQPFHAAALTDGEVAVLLAGPSGSGKSSLAYAAAKEGLGVLAEDFVNLQLEPALRVWGMPGHVHLTESAVEHFPELTGRESVVTGGKRKIAVELTSMEAAPDRFFADRAGICVLAEGADEARLVRLSAEEVEAALRADFPPGFDIFTDTIGEGIRAIAAAGGWRLERGATPQETLAVLRDAFVELRRGG